ncbi:MAG: NAD(P)/FAD-dependent oxidoreductase, partial [Candidatus Aenigmarchaeota archaeon]|nr:NAD(P)/FAD-dependent oxidoreductase [Candidatus Aenigmarchaeota archaeon]
MDRINCDVLIVGAGPAGSSAARACAKKGLKTIFIDKRKEIGVPALCAEGIGSYLFSYLPKDIIIPKEQLIWKIDGIRFCCENYIIDKTGGFWDGYAVDRTKFDKWLSYLAIEKGARLFTDTELIELIQDKNKYVKKAIIKKQGDLLEVYPKIVIGADGVDSKVSKLTGLYKGEKYNIIEV